MNYKWGSFASGISILHKSAIVKIAPLARIFLPAIKTWIVEINSSMIIDNNADWYRIIWKGSEKTVNRRPTTYYL